MSRQRNSWVSVVERAYRAAQRVMTLDITRLIRLDAEHLRLPTLDPRCHFRFLAANELECLVDNPANLLTDELVERASRGRDHCFAACDGQNLAAFVWIAEGSLEAEHNRGRSSASGVAASFDDDAGFVYHAYTLPAYRGRQLSPACMALALQSLGARGITRLWTTTAWSNDSFRSACRKIGAVELGTIWCVGWGDATLKFVPRRAAAAGLRLGRRARVEKRTCRPPQLLEA